MLFVGIVGRRQIHTGPVRRLEVAGSACAAEGFAGTGE